MRVDLAHREPQRVVVRKRIGIDISDVAQPGARPDGAVERKRGNGPDRHRSWINILIKIALNAEVFTLGADVAQLHDHALRQLLLEVQVVALNISIAEERINRTGCK